MTGSPETQQSLQHKFQKPFSGNLEKAKQELSDLEILDGMVKFRDDLEAIYTDEVDVDAPPETKRQWKLAAKFGLDNQVLQFRRIERGLDFLDKLSLIRSGVALFVSFPILSFLGLSQFEAGILSPIASIILYFIRIGLPYGQVFVNQIGYQRISTRSAGEVVKFRTGWNKGVMNSPSCTIGIFLIGVLGLRAETGYNWALRIIRYHVRWRG